MTEAAIVAQRFVIARLLAGFAVAPTLGNLVSCSILDPAIPPHLWLPTALSLTVYLGFAIVLYYVPIYLLLQATRRTSWRSYVCCGALLWSFVGLLLVRDSDVFASGLRDKMFLIGRFALGGIVAGLGFWVIVRPDHGARARH